jgi:acyl dehydratase
MEFLEDIAIGARHEVGAWTFTAEDIKRFASAFDPQPFHVDEEAAARSHFGTLIASGWHSQAVWMKLTVAHWQRRRAEREAAGLPLARIGPSPGFDSLKWLKPVRAGDTISFVNEVTAKRLSDSRPGWGLVTVRATGRNQHGEKAIAFTGHVFVESRGDAAGEAPD